MDGSSADNNINNINNYNGVYNTNTVTGRTGFLLLENEIETNKNEAITIIPSRLERQNNPKEEKHNRILEILRITAILILLVLIFGGFLFSSTVDYDRKSAHLFRSGLCSVDTKFTSKYAIVFDAGSTGSRVHVYEFQFCGEKLLNLVDEIFEQVHPGLSSFSHRPDEAVDSLVPLLRQAWRRVPRDLRRCTPIVLKATAGLRLLPQERVTGILENVKSWLDDQPFHLPQSNSGFSPDPVSVIDGSEEAVSAWISVNYLQGHIQPSPIKANDPAIDRVTSVVLEMGGGSSQIVFDQVETKSSEHPGGVIDLNFFGNKFQLYQHSYLGYGLMEARRSIKKGFEERNKGNSGNFPCFPTGYTETSKISTFQFVGNSAGWSECSNLVESVLFKQSDKVNCSQIPCSFNGVHQPNIPEKSPIYALSYINDRARDLKLSVEGRTEFTLKQLREKAQQVCSESYLKQELYEKVPDLCLDLAFIHTLLHKGYKIPEDRLITSGQSINGYETGWTLGSALAVIESAPTFCNK